MLIAPIAQARGALDYANGQDKSVLCIAALSSIGICVPARLFSGYVNTSRSTGDDNVVLGNRPSSSDRNQGCHRSGRSDDRKRQRQRLVEALLGVKMPDLSFNMQGLKLALDVETDLTGFHYNGVKLEYQTCW